MTTDRWFGADNRPSPFLALGDVTLGPTAGAAFIAAHPEHTIAEASEPVDLTPELRVDMLKVSGQVNQCVEWVPPTGELMEPWHILLADNVPAGRGDCCSFAATKRAMLLMYGFKPAQVLFAEVVPPEYPDFRHLVLVVRTKVGDLVLDNLAPYQAPVWWARHYVRWVRVQSPDPNPPGAWRTVATPTRMAA